MGELQSCKLNMLTYIITLSLMFPSSPCSISVVLHMFVYTFKGVILVHDVPSIHFRGRHECEKWKIRLWSTCRVLKCSCLIKCKCKELILCLLRFWAHGAYYLHVCGNTLVDRCLLPRSPKEQKVIRDMTCPSIIFRTSDGGGIFLRKSEIYFYITWKLWVAVTQDLKKKNENSLNWNILVKCSFCKKILIWKKHMWMLFRQAKHTQNTGNIQAIITDPEYAISKNFQS